MTAARATATDQQFADLLARVEAADEAEEGLRRRVVAAMWSTRECQAGMAFGVPPDAREMFLAALADAALAVIRADADAAPAGQDETGRARR